MSTAPAGPAKSLGDAHGKVTDEQGFVDWIGDATLYEVHPPLNGFPKVVASTVQDAPRFSTTGAQYGVETLLFGVSSDNIQSDEELPYGGWGDTAEQALAEAGYRIV